MGSLALGMVLLLAMVGYSSAAYCLCNSGLSDSVLQKNIDYACGAGADCTQILQNGACFNPNTVRDHCNYAVNSYFQRKGEVQGSCDFAGTAAPSQTPPSGATSACYPSSPISGGSTPGATPSPPGVLTPPGSSTPGFSPPSGFISPPFGGGLGPTTNDNSAASPKTLHQTCSSLTLSLVFSCLILVRLLI